VKHSPARSHPTSHSSPGTVLVTTLCWLAVIADGYDLIVYGTVLPVLSDEPKWHLNDKQLGLIGALTFLGMLVGAVVVGLLSDRFGRRAPLLACISWFSLCMIACATAGSPFWLGTARFLAGLGLGGLVPTASALLLEYAPPRHRTFVYALALSGIPLGGVIATLLSLPILPEPGWRVLFWIGAAPLVLIVPLAWLYLPESMQHLVDHGHGRQARSIAEKHGLIVPEPTRAAAGNHSSVLFRGRNLRASLCFWAATFLALLTWYGLGTWLPKIMRTAGYALGSAVTALLLLSIGGVIGSWTIARAGDRFGHRRVTASSFLLTGAALLLLSRPATTPLLYALLVVAGTGAVSCQVLINSYVGDYFPAHCQGGALGWSLGVGRTGAIAGPLLVGILLDHDLSYRWSFYLFAGCALLGAAIMGVVPHGMADDAHDPSRAAGSGSAPVQVPRRPPD
jgi:AAHS family benzoate transporter-like MFS transporter